MEAGALGKGEVKFEDVRLYLVERKMGRSRRSFLTQLARSKGFIVEDVLRLEKHCHSVYHYFFFFIYLGRAGCRESFFNLETHENTKYRAGGCERI